MFEAFGSSDESFKVPRRGRRSTSLIAMLSDLCDVVTWEGLSSSDGYLRGFRGAPNGVAEKRFVVPDLDRAEELRPYRLPNADRLRLHGRAQWDPSPFYQMSCGLLFKNLILCFVLNVCPMSLMSRTFKRNRRAKFSSLQKYGT